MSNVMAVERLKYNDHGPVHSNARAQFCLQTSTLFRRFMDLGNRKCVRCGADLGDEDVMKIILEDGSCEIFPFSRCPQCFKKYLVDSVSQKNKGDDF